MEVWGHAFKTNTNPVFILQKLTVRVVSPNTLFAELKFCPFYSLHVSPGLRMTLFSFFMRLFTLEKP